MSIFEELIATIIYTTGFLIDDLISSIFLMVNDWLIAPLMVDVDVS